MLWWLKQMHKLHERSEPLVSIITVVFNGERYLEETIKSVINQTYKNIEYIIIDGGSTDNTLNIIKKYEDKIDYWISEKDKGIYDAINKGIKLSRGELIGIINADDYYEIDVLEKVVSIYTKDSEVIKMAAKKADIEQIVPGIKIQVIHSQIKPELAEKVIDAFENKEFDVSLSSHLLFVYDNMLDYEFHKNSILELLRVSKEVRIFPLVDFKNSRVDEEKNFSPFVYKILDELKEFKCQIVKVDFEFQPRANYYLSIS
jgi:glycosyltransferase involved in cell wall biosynthesis